MKNLLNRIHPDFRPILLGVLVFAVFNCLLTGVVTFSPINKKFNFSYGNFLPTKLEMLAQNHPQQLDVLFLGTSQTNNGFIPSVFEKAAGQPINSFNLGLPNNRYDIMQAYLEYHIHQYGKPKVVLIELSPSTQEIDSYYYYLPALYYRTLIERSPQRATVFLSHPLLAWNVKKELLLSAFSSLHQYRFTFSPVNILDKVSGKLAGLFRRAEAVAEASGKSAETAHKAESDVRTVEITPEMTAKGWYPYEQSVHMKTPEGVALSVQEAKKYYIDHQAGVHFDKLRLLIAACRKYQVPVVLVSWPQHPAFTKILEESPLGKQYRQGLAQLSAQANVPVIDLNHSLPQNPSPSLFADPRHLTPEGAKLFSGVLAKQTLALPLVRQQLNANPQYLSER
jgi:hypothetical protein